MSKHTPGPWYVDGDYVSGVDIGNTEGTSIFYACCCGHVTGDSEQRTANARLIAAAPEMYELISDLSQTYDDNQSGHELASRLYDLQCVALRLMAKIDGGGE